MVNVQETRVGISLAVKARGKMSTFHIEYLLLIPDDFPLVKNGILATHIIVVCVWAEYLFPRFLPLKKAF